MARAETKTLLSLDRFARVMGVHPLHFNGVYVQDLAPATTCGQPLVQYDWQTADGVSRESIAVAIADAESRLAQWLGFKPLPSFELDERHGFVRPADPSLMRASLMQADGLAIATQLDWGYVVAGGIEKRDPIQLNVNVTYSDGDADGYKETATIAVGTTVTDPNEIIIAFPGEGGMVEWEIRPIRVSIAGGVATITARREQLVNPSTQESMVTGTRGVDGSVDANFAPRVDVYRAWHDPSQQVQFLWENPGSACGCNSSACQACYIGAQFGCSIVRDYRLGLISGIPAVWDDLAQAYAATTYFVPRAPDKARWWYRAGYRDTTQLRPFRDMDRRWERAISIFAASMLERPFCGCKSAESITHYWQEDLGMSTTDHSFRVGQKWLDNPLGTTRGAIEAWRIIRTEALGGR